MRTDRDPEYDPFGFEYDEDEFASGDIPLLLRPTLIEALR